MLFNKPMNNLIPRLLTIIIIINNKIFLQSLLDIKYDSTEDNDYSIELR